MKSPQRILPVAVGLGLTIIIVACGDRQDPLGVDPGSAVTTISPTGDPTQVDLSGWTAESYPAVSGFSPGSWNVSSDGLTVVQTANGQPTFFYSDFDAFKTEVQGVIRVNTTSDDDFIGFALGFRPGDTTNEDAEYLLVDWKQGTQTFDFGSPSCTPGSAAQAGLAVSRVFGIPTADELWGHENFDTPACSDLNHGVEELARANNLGSTGWQEYTDYIFSFQFTATLLRVYVDGELELEIEGEFNNGRLAFYNFSQAQVEYSAFTITEFNNAPTAEVDDYEVDEDMEIEVGAAAGILANDADPDADALTAVLVTGPENGSLTLNGDGSFTYRPNADYHGSDGFTYYASDGDLDSDPVAVSITIYSVNDAPVADAGGPYETNEGSVIGFDASGSTDVESDPLTYEWDFGNGNSATGIAPTHTYVDDGVYTVTLTVSDGAETDQASVTVTIENADPAIGSVTAPSTAAVGSTVTVNATFSDPGIDDTHTAQIFWGDGSDATPATVTGSGGSGSLEGSHTYTAAGTYTITVEVTDKDGGIASSTAEIVIEIPTETPIQDAELAEIDSAIDGYLGDGSIDSPGIAKGLKSLLKNSDAALQRGNTRAAKNTLGAFQKHVEAQSGKHIAENAATDLSTRAEVKRNKIGG